MPASSPISHRIVICSTCASKPDVAPEGAEFAQALRTLVARAKLDCVVETHACLSACASPLAMGVSGAGKATYLFADVRPSEDAEDTLAFLKMYAEADDGWIEDARAAGRLRHCLIGRMPA